MLNFIQQNVIMLSVTKIKSLAYAVGHTLAHYAECIYAECHQNKYHYDESKSFIISFL
jgi:hypothetical protein